MTYEFRMPDIGEGTAEVEIVEWLVPIGGRVEQDQPIVTVETDKARVDIPTPVAGTVAAVAAEPGAFVEVGSVLFTLDDGGDAAPAAAPPAATEPPAAAAPPAAAQPPPAAEPQPARHRVKAAPTVRRLAEELGVDLGDLAGSGPDGRVTKEDVLAATASPGGAATRESRQPGKQDEDDRSEDELVPLRGLRRQIARNMIQSWRTIPHIIDWREADATRLIELRAQLRATHPEHAGRLTYLPLLVKIVATTLRDHPLMNASITPEEDGYVLHRRIHIGIATSTPDGLLVPVVRDADRKSVLELAAELTELIELTRTRKASAEQLTGGTYTVNNVGALGARMGNPIIRSPEVGILGFGRIADTVVARDGQPVVRPVMTLSSVADHRLLDGEQLSAFTAQVAALIEQPARLLGTLR